MDKLSPSNFIEMRNRTVLKRKVSTKLPSTLQPFKQKKLTALRSTLPWRPRGPRPIDSRPLKQKLRTLSNRSTATALTGASATLDPASGTTASSPTAPLKSEAPAPQNRAIPVTPTTKNITVIRSPTGPIEVLVKKASFNPDTPPSTAMATGPTLAPRQCPTQPTQLPDIPLSHFANFMQAATATGGYSELKFLFPDTNLDKRVLFGQNFNYRFPVTPTFPVQNLVSHFVCTQLIPLQLAVIVPQGYVPSPSDPCDCVAITVNDIPFVARIVPFDVLRSTLQESFAK